MADTTDATKIYKYDKFGAASGTCGTYGDSWINRVYSKVAPS
jgi:hypothetical protein